MNTPDTLTPYDLAYQALPNSRWYTPTEAWDAYERLCKRSDALALYAQWHNAIKRLVREGHARLNRETRTIRGVK
jgi:hypothetical protein